MCVGFQCRIVTTSRIFVYISNESNVNVFFDNMQVRHDRGRIIEENHYYAFGLKIAAISSRLMERQITIIYTRAILVILMMTLAGTILS